MTVSAISSSYTILGHTAQMHYNLISNSSVLDIYIIFKLFSAVILSNSEMHVS